MRGSMREKKPGVWQLRVYCGRNTAGRQVMRHRTVRGGRRTAESALATFVAEVEAQHRAVPEGTLEHLLERWLDLVDRDRSPTTAAEYRRLADKRVIPALGAKRLHRLGPADLDAFYTALTDEGLSPSSVRRVHALISRACAQAVKWGWMATNPAARASPPVVRPPERDAPDLDAALTVFAAADKLHPELAGLWRLAAASGLRRGELAGLRWSDINGQELRVRRSIAVVKGEIIEKEPKTRQGRRLLLPDAAAQLVAARKTWQKEVAAELDVVLPDDPWLWSLRVEANRPPNPSSLTEAWNRARDATKVEGFRLHDLRHLQATILIDAGIPLPVVSQRLGHANLTTTANIYTHAVAARDSEAADIAGGAFFDEDKGEDGNGDQDDDDR
ncbi:MAG: site-specific integrase [Acidimicrobiia bacterium]|nr:site-specific integrase [Acidimicrobiia bacterium]